MKYHNTNITECIEFLTEGTCCPLETSDSHVLSKASVSLAASLASNISS